MDYGINWNQVTGPRSSPIPQTTVNSIQLPPTPQPQLPLLSIVYVDGRQGAIDFPTPANCPGIPLMDRNSNTMFVKSTDSYGNISQLLEFDVNLRKSQEQVRQEEFSAFDERLKRIEEALLNGKSDNGGDATIDATIVEPDNSKRRHNR